MRNSHPLALVAVFVWPVLAAALSFGQVVATTQPGVAPGNVAGGPAIAPPPAAAPAPIAADGRIAVLPFAPTNPQAGNAWIGKSIQQSLSADLLQAAPGRVQTADAAVSTSADAAAAGHQLGVNYVVFGTYTSADSSVRIIGQVVDCANGNAVTALKVTGKLGDVFVLEDDLSHQARAALLGPSAAQAGPAYTVHQVPENSGYGQTYYPPNGQATAPQSATGYAYPDQSQAAPQYSQTYSASPGAVYYSYPSYSYSYYSYPYYPYYTYPYYGWGYPYLGIGLGFYGGHYYGGYHGGFHGGFGGGGFHGGGGGFHGGGGGFHGGGGGGHR